MPVKLEDNFDEAHKRARKLSGERNVPLTLLFNDDFMARHTKFDSWQQLLDAGAIKTVEDISAELLSKLVTANSSFASFTEMHAAAFHEWAQRELGA